MMVITESQPEQIVYGFLRSFASAIEQSKVQGAFGGHVVSGQRFQILHAALDVIEGKSARIGLAQERLYGFR